MNEPQTDAGKALLDYIHSGFDGDDDPAALVVAVERAAAAWGKFRGLEIARTAASDGVYVGPIQHDNGMCKKDGCSCWCQACERHNWRHAQ